MPVNAGLLNGLNRQTRITTPDKLGMEAQTQNILASRQRMKHQQNVDAQNAITAKNTEMDAEQKASLEAMGRIYKVEQGWVSKYTKDGMDEQTANQQAITTVSPYAQQELDHHNKRFGTKYTINDVNQARAPMQQIMTGYEQKMALQKQKSSAAMKRTKYTTDHKGGGTATHQTTNGPMKTSRLISIWKTETHQTGNISNAETMYYMRHPNEKPTTPSGAKFLEWWKQSDLNPKAKKPQATSAMQTSAKNMGLTILK